ncbi:MAG: tyrosine-type recombinase/integrase [Pseudomonadales bacterium]
MDKGRNFNHPGKGASIKVHPIRHVKDITAIKTLLECQPRNLCLFTMGINTAYRAGELLSLTVGQVSDLKIRDRLEIKQDKNQKYRAITLNKTTVDAVQNWLIVHPLYDRPAAPLFISQRGRQSLTVATVNHFVKRWCKAIGLTENYGSHSLRKTWGYHQRIHHDTSVALLMRAFGHDKEAQTLEYLCIQSDEIQALYMGMEL